eukprot:GHVL01023178.1.p1 GENE.GHVL01023178.1~~GHVL01023178.1.p1  ORF type:complete len:315 (+),score=47.37 GHVL01023178.1:55-999(+)
MINEKLDRFTMNILNQILIPENSDFLSDRTGRRLACVMSVLEQVYELKDTNTHATIRDVFYSNPALFKCQDTSDRAIKRITRSIKAERAALNIVASSKSLLRGKIRLETRSGAMLDGSADLFARGLLLPANPTEIVNIECDAKILLVVEKETIFNRLLDEDFHNKYPNILLLTAKGNPDLSSRNLIKKLTTKYSDILLYLLVDYDPWGLSIALTYTIGGKAISYYDRFFEPNFTLIVPDSIQEAKNRWGLSTVDCLQMTNHDKEHLRNVQERLVSYPSQIRTLETANKMMEKSIKYEIDALTHLTSLIVHNLKL